MAHDNTNKGTLGKNTRKEADTHPDYAGQINVDGVDYWLNGWLKTNGTTGEKFFSLSVKPKQARQEQRQPEPQRQGGHPPSGDLDDEIPFAACKD